MANIDRIVNCQISLNTAGVTTEGFSTLLICTVNESLPSTVTTITDVDQLTEMGIDSTAPVYKAVSAAMSQIPRPAFVKVGKLITTTDEEDEERTVVKIAESMTAIASADNDFYGVALTEKEDEYIFAMADWCEAHSKLFVVSYSSSDMLDQENSSDIASRLMDKQYYRTAIWYHSDSTEFVECAVASRCFAIQAGGETWANKRLSAVTANSLTETNYITLKNKNCNTFEKFRNVAITQLGKVCAGEWIDVIRFRDWLVEEIRTTEFQTLINLDKLPYTDGGIAIVENILNKALALGQKRGGIAPNEFDAEGNLNYGYIIEVPLASEISANKKASRVLEDVKFTARLAGAIHTIEIKGALTYSNLIG